jgi:hypothetical protein
VGSSGAFTSAPLSALGGVQYQAALPALACGQKLEFYFEILNAVGVPLRSPLNAPEAGVHHAIAGRNLVVYDFQSASGWTASAMGGTGGPWQRGVPVNDPNWPYDPREDADASGSCWLTGNNLGSSDLDNGSVLLTSPVINVPALLAPGEQASLAYAWHLHHVSPAGGDLVRLDVSTTGTAGPYSPTVTHTGSGTLWNRARHPTAQAGGSIALSANTAIRFIATDGNPQSIVEAAIDDVRVMGDCATTTCRADANHDGAVDVDDLIAVILSWGACGPPGPPCPADIAPPGGNGQVDVDDLIAIILGWGACP